MKIKEPKKQNYHQNQEAVPAFGVLVVAEGQTCTVVRLLVRGEEKHAEGEVAGDGLVFFQRRSWSTATNHGYKCDNKNNVSHN